MSDPATTAPMPAGWCEDASAPREDALAASLRGSVRCPLDDRGYLEVRGTDAATHLHGQFSSDITGLAPGAVRLSSYSDARGRVLAVVRVIAEGERFLLELPAERLEPVRSQLLKYVLRADVRIRDASAETARFGLAGESAAVALGAAAGPLPEALGLTHTTADGARTFRVEGPRPRWIVLGPAAAVAPLWQALRGHALRGDAEAWRLLDIEAGLPCIEGESTGRYVAQMLNLDRLDALDFRKGCYPGQEVIARTRYLGRVKRRMFLLRTAGHGIPACGTSVVRADGQAAGQILYAAHHPEGGALALAVLQLDAADSGLHLDGTDGPAAEARTPPYPLDEAA